ncbi:MAG TPA: EAL domain-containing protein [Thermoleophilaceae bacterium]|nr:EAL domain-containing protein [Thermoleophilaceae bacterium]
MRRGLRAQKVLVASAARVAPGGESGWFQWLVPALVVIVVLFAALTVRSEADKAGTANTAAQRGQAFSAAVRESRALQQAVKASHGGNAEIKAQASLSIGRMQTALAPLVDIARGDPAVTAIARQVHDARTAHDPTSLGPVAASADTLAKDLDDRARSTADSAHQRLTLTLVGGALLAALMLWSFFAKRARIQLERSERRFRSLVEHSNELVAVVDEKKRIRFVTPTFHRRLGYDPDDLLGSSLLGLVHVEDQKQVRLEDPRAEGDESPRRWRLKHSDGSWVETEMEAKDLLDDPAVRGYVVTIQDVGHRRMLEEQIRHAAFHDSLTALPNRALFEDRLNHALERSRRDPEQGAAVVFIDLDDFKTVNDSLGHGAGDDLLKAFAGCLADCTRRADTVARFGGDEFAVLVEGFLAEDAALVIADRIHATLDKPIRLEQDDVYVHASVGIATGDVGTTADEVVRNADLAMYSAKADGKGQTACFEPRMHSAVRKRLQLTGDLRRALDEGQLTVNYQPLIRLEDGRMLGAEALLRWSHPQLGMVPPAEFIPLAEESGLIMSIGNFVLNQACRQLKSWQSEHPGNHPDYVSVNLSVRQFQREGQVVEEVRQAIQDSGIRGANLMLEVTESVLMEDRKPIIRDLEALRSLGVRIAIDDFGTGYSALSYLREFPIDTVKMDRSFVHNLGNDAADSALVRSVVELGEALDMQIIAEGIEGQGQLDSVTGLRCDIGQGYFFAPPLDADAMRSLLNDEPAAATAPQSPSPSPTVEELRKVTP